MDYGKYFLLTCGAFIGSIGIAYTIAPSALLGLYDLAPLSSELLSHIRATNGGMMISVALLLMLGAYQQQIRSTSLICLATIAVGLSAGRAFGIVIDGLPNSQTLLTLMIETSIAWCSIWLLPQDPKSWPNNSATIRGGDEATSANITGHSEAPPA